MIATGVYVNTYAAARIAGITYRQLDYWCRQGIIEPTVGAVGSGSRREFSRDEVRLAWAMAQLRSLGAPFDVLAAVGRSLRWRGEWPDRIYATHEQVASFPLPVCWSIDLTRVPAEVAS